MTLSEFNVKKEAIISGYENLITRDNTPKENGNGIFDRYINPIITASHIPPDWIYDFSYDSNPHLMTRLGINAAFNAGAIYLNGKYILIVRVEGYDRKSFFAVAESPNGIDNFRFWDYPVIMPPDGDNPETNVYDMRLTHHEDGWIYGLFCAEYKDSSPETQNDLSAAKAVCGIARTKDLKKWERLKNLESEFQQRNVVLHPEFVDGKYALYTRPLKAFMATGSGEGIGWALIDDITNAKISGKEVIFDRNVYHTIKEGKNGQGPAPLKTKDGWLHLAHAVRNTAAGMRYVLYAFLTDLKNPSKIIAQPGGYLLAPEDEERIGDVSNVLFTNGWIRNSNGGVFIYYASSDTRLHVATTTVEKLVDYCKDTPEDALVSHKSVQQRIGLIKKNMKK